ncbi:protein kinase [Chloracidobacterium sp. MS 40/45]|uniref:serine/threonine protein kinase n=1 Tax=Chloracidobacterium aggregatum TaxID=2851959 RepID=UPI001B8CC56F|nr:protein kinase [Chloracidobacterium aggregatum]QUW00711.1 protein kinase [Chloracidobacterium sp. MS 40/45]
MSGDVLQLESMLLAGRYRIRSRLVTESRSGIFLALDDVSRQLVVVKAFPTPCSAPGLPAPTADGLGWRQTRFRLEGVWLDRVSHPYIVLRLAGGSAHDPAGCPFDYHVLEYLPGGTLAALSHAWQGLPLLKTVNLLRQAAAALTHCHALGIIHGDVVPENLLLTSDHRTVKLADFGSATGDDEPAAMDEGKFAGRLSRYAPPEARLGAGLPLSAAADVYALARTFQATLTGDPFLESQTPIQTLPPKLATQPGAEALLQVLQRATATNVTDRYPTVAAFWAEAEQAVAAMPATDAPPVMPVAIPAAVVTPVQAAPDGPPAATDEADDSAVVTGAAGETSREDISPVALPPPLTTRLIGVGVVVAVVALFIGGLVALYRLARASARAHWHGQPPPATSARPLFQVKVLRPTRAYATPTENPTPRDWLGELPAGVEADVLEISGRFYRVRPQRWGRRKSPAVNEGWVLREHVDGGL